MQFLDSNVVHFLVFLSVLACAPRNAIAQVTEPRDSQSVDSLKEGSEKMLDVQVPNSRLYALVAKDVMAKVRRDEAIRRAAEGVGLRDFDPVNVTPSIVTLTRESLPFLGKEIAGLKTWRVEFNDLKLDQATGNPKLANEHIRKLIVYLAPTTGQVMRVVSPWPEGTPRIPPYPSAADEEMQMRGGLHSYSGLPAKPPGVSLLDVLPKGMLWSPEVKQVSALYLWQSKTIPYDDQPVWIVQLRGVRLPIMSSAPRLGIPANVPVPARTEDDKTRDHLRNVFDAQSGEWLFGTNRPRPPKVYDESLPLLEDRY